LGGGFASERRRWNGGGVAAGTRTPARTGAELVNVWHGWLLCDLVEALRWLVGSGIARRAELIDSGSGAAAGTRFAAIGQFGQAITQACKL
jgi:hypothetical protein